MNRRSFFAALAASPAAPIALAPVRPPTTYAQFGAHMICNCGYAMIREYADWRHPVVTQLLCINPRCGQRGVRFHEPRIALERA
jgi:hypothetical protein